MTNHLDKCVLCVWKQQQKPRWLNNVPSTFHPLRTTRSSLCLLLCLHFFSRLPLSLIISLHPFLPLIQTLSTLLIPLSLPLPSCTTLGDEWINKLHAHTHRHDRTRTRQCWQIDRVGEYFAVIKWGTPALHHHELCVSYREISVAVGCVCVCVCVHEPPMFTKCLPKMIL